MKTSAVILFGLLVVLVGISAWRARQPSLRRTNVEPASEVADELSELRAEVAQLKRHQDLDVKLAVGALSSASRAASPERPETLEEMAAKAEAKDARIAETLSQKLRDERIDVAWSGETSAQIQSAFKTILPGTEVVDARCASTLCRVVVRHPEKDEQAAMPRRLAAVQPFAQGTFLRYDYQSDPPLTTLFVLRNGQVPPEVSSL